MADGHGLDAAELRLARRLGRAEDPLETRASRALSDREGAANRPDAAVERELAHRGMLGQSLCRKLLRRGQDREGNRQVEARALLPQTCGREVDGDPLQRPVELRGADAATDSVLRLSAGPVCETDDREARQAAVDVRLHLDPAGLEPDQSMGDGAREHTRNATERLATDECPNRA